MHHFQLRVTRQEVEANLEPLDPSAPLLTSSSSSKTSAAPPPTTVSYEIETAAQALEGKLTKPAQTPPTPGGSDGSQETKSTVVAGAGSREDVGE